MKNTVIRECDQCGFKKDSDLWMYLGMGVFSCTKCGCKYTHIAEIVEND